MLKSERIPWDREEREGYPFNDMEKPDRPQEGLGVGFASILYCTASSPRSLPQPVHRSNLRNPESASSVNGSPKRNRIFGCAVPEDSVGVNPAQFHRWPECRQSDYAGSRIEAA
jgi:hypothetical protein